MTDTYKIGDHARVSGSFGGLYDVVVTEPDPSYVWVRATDSEKSIAVPVSALCPPLAPVALEQAVADLLAIVDSRMLGAIGADQLEVLRLSLDAHQKGAG